MITNSNFWAWGSHFNSVRGDLFVGVEREMARLCANGWKIDFPDFDALEKASLNKKTYTVYGWMNITSRCADVGNLATLVALTKLGVSPGSLVEVEKLRRALKTVFSPGEAKNIVDYFALSSVSSSNAARKQLVNICRGTHLTVLNATDVECFFFLPFAKELAEEIEKWMQSSKRKKQYADFVDRAAHAFGKVNIFFLDQKPPETPCLKDYISTCYEDVWRWLSERCDSIACSCTVAPKELFEEAFGEAALCASLGTDPLLRFCPFLPRPFPKPTSTWPPAVCPEPVERMELKTADLWTSLPAWKNRLEMWREECLKRSSKEHLEADVVAAFVDLMSGIGSVEDLVASFGCEQVPEWPWGEPHAAALDSRKKQFLKRSFRSRSDEEIEAALAWAEAVDRIDVMSRTDRRGLRPSVEVLAAVFRWLDDGDESSLARALKWALPDHVPDFWNGEMTPTMGGSVAVESGSAPFPEAVVKDVFERLHEEASACGVTASEFAATVFRAVAVGATCGGSVCGPLFEVFPERAVERPRASEAVSRFEAAFC